MMDGSGAWVVFEVGAETLALPAPAVVRVLFQPVLVRMPALEDNPITRAVQFGNELIPLVALARSTPTVAAEFVIVATRNGRIAIAVDKVLRVGGVVGTSVRCLEPDSLASQLPPRQRPAVLPDPARRRTVSDPAWRPEPANRVLHFEANSADWLLAAAEIVWVQDHAAITPVPNAPPALLGAVLLHGAVVPVVSLPGFDERRRGAGAEPRPIIVVRTGQGLLALAADRLRGWTTAGRVPGARHAAIDTLRATARLAPAPEQVEPAARATDAALCSLMPMMIGAQRYAVRLAHVERVMPVSPVTRLPNGPQRHSLLDGALAVDGRIVPLTFGRRWLGVHGAGQSATTIETDQCHVLLRLNAGLHVLAVDGVGRPFVCEEALLQPLHDPTKRFAALARVHEETLAVLDLAALSAVGMG